MPSPFAPPPPPAFLSPTPEQRQRTDGGSDSYGRSGGSGRKRDKESRERKRERRAAKQRQQQQEHDGRTVEQQRRGADPLSSFQSTLTDLDNSAGSGSLSASMTSDPLDAFAEFENSASLDDSFGFGASRESGTPSRRGRTSGGGSLDGSARKKDRHEGETKAEREERKRLKRERRAARQRKKEAAEEQKQKQLEHRQRKQEEKQEKERRRQQRQQTESSGSKPPRPGQRANGDDDNDDDAQYEEDFNDDDDEFLELSGSESVSNVDVNATDRISRGGGQPPPPPAFSETTVTTRPTSARPRSASSRPSSATSSSRPSSASSLRTSARPTSARPGSRPTSARPTSRPSSAARPGSAARSRPSSAASTRPGSADARKAQLLDAERVKQELEMWEQEQGHVAGNQGEDRLDLVKEELEMWEKEVTISEQPESPSSKSKQQAEDEDGDEGTGAGGGEDSFLSDGRTDGIAGDVQIHRVFLENPGSRRGEEPLPLGFVSLNLNECDGTLSDVRHQVEFLDNAPTSYTFMFDGMPVGKGQEGQLRAAFCDQLILRPDGSSEPAARSADASTPPPSRSSRTISAGKGDSIGNEARAASKNVSDLSPLATSGEPLTEMPLSARSEPNPDTKSAQKQQQAAPRGVRGGTTTGALREVPQPPARSSPTPPQFQWKQGPAMTAAHKQKLRPFKFAVDKIPDIEGIIPPGRLGRIKREKLEAERLRKAQQILRAKELMKDPSLSDGQKKARDRIRARNAVGTPSNERRLAQNAVWKPEMRGPLLVIEHDAVEPRYWSAAQELVASLRRATDRCASTIETYLPNPRAASDGSTQNDYRSFNRYCFPDGIRFRPRTGSFEVYLVHPPDYQLMYSKLESGSRGYAPICPIASVVDSIKHVLSPEGQKIPRTVFRCREDTGIIAAHQEASSGTNNMVTGRLRQPEPEPEPEPEPKARPSSAPERKSQPVVLNVPVAKPQQSAADSVGSVEDEDVFGTVEEIDAEVVDDYGVDDDFEDAVDRPKSRVDTVMSEDDIVEEHDVQYDVVRDEISDEFVNEVVSEAGSMVEEVPGSDERFGAARPHSRISSEEADYDEDFDDEDYKSEEDSDYVPPVDTTPQASQADDTGRQQHDQSNLQGVRADDAPDNAIVAGGVIGTGEKTGGTELQPLPTTAKVGATTNAKKKNRSKPKPKPKPKQRQAGHGPKRRVASAPPGGRRTGARTAPRRKRRVRGAKPAREPTEQERADHLRLMEAAGLLQADRQTPLVLGAYGGNTVGQGDAGTMGLGFRELRYNDARNLLENAEQRLSDAEQIRRAAGARQYVDSAPPATRSMDIVAAAHMQHLPQEDYVLVPTRVLAAAKGRKGLTLPLTLDIPVPTTDVYPQQQTLPYTGMQNKPGFSRDGWGVSHYSVGRGRAAGAAKRPKAKQRGGGRKKQMPSSAQRLPAAA